jgi:hypothetical protein
LETGPVTARANHAAVESAALARIAELETQIARERAESARRQKDVAPRIRELRKALHSMQMKLQHAAEEHVLLDARLAGDAYEIERLTHRVAELEEQILRGTAPAAERPDGEHPARVEATASPPRRAEPRGVAKFVAARLKKLRPR